MTEETLNPAHASGNEDVTCFAVKLVDPALGGDGERIPLPGSLVSGSRGAEGVAAIPADRPCPQAYGLRGDSTHVTAHK